MHGRIFVVSEEGILDPHVLGPVDEQSADVSAVVVIGSDALEERLVWGHEARRVCSNPYVAAAVGGVVLEGTQGEMFC